MELNNNTNFGQVSQTRKTETVRADYAQRVQTCDQLLDYFDQLGDHKGMSHYQDVTMHPVSPDAFYQN